MESTTGTHNLTAGCATVKTSNEPWDGQCKKQQSIPDDGSTVIATPDDRQDHAITKPKLQNGFDKTSRRLEQEHTSDRTKQVPVTNVDRCSQPSKVDTQTRIPENTQQTVFERMCGAVKILLECIGEDPNREGLLGTPSRFSETLLFLTSGYQCNVEQIVNDAVFREEYRGMIIVKDIEIYTLCEHHLLPFTGKMSIGYVPSGTVIGLSKLPRIAEMFSRRLQIQERLTREVAHAVMKILNSQGVAVLMASSHLCMERRGVRKTGTSTVTSEFLGCFESPEIRNEFHARLQVTRRDDRDRSS